MTDLDLTGRKPRREFQKTRAEILSHPLRVRMLEIANQIDISAVSFVRGAYARTLLAHLDEGTAVSQVAYHFRKLLRSGCVEVVEHRVRRGAVENVYRGVARARFTAEEWKSLDQDRREEISGVVIQALMARAESAMLEGTFDARDDRWLAWVQMSLDEQGWDEICALCTRMMDDVERVREAAEERLGRAGEPVRTTPFTWGMLSFESPPS
ncbi:MAG: helix-turn-helix transcriptional regulator [Actinobacteria bacterium]|nr:helix-turn-helix transcriptional regulator [Actinomycetota bacterium]